MHFGLILLFIFIVRYVDSIRNPLLVHMAEQQSRITTTEANIYRQRPVTRSTTTSSSIDIFAASTSTSFLQYYQPSPTFAAEIVPSNQTANNCPRQKNVHRNCQRSCGSGENNNCRHQRLCTCDHNCGFSCLSRAILSEKYLCPILNQPRHGRIHYNGHSFYSRLVYECNSGYTVVGPKERVCVSDGFWEPVADVYCIRNDEVCTMDVLILNGRHVPQQQVYYPHQQVRIECDSGYELDRASPIQTCHVNGTWSPVETPRCLKSPCGEPPSISNAYLINSTSKFVQYACYDTYTFKDSLSKIECKDGRWQNPQPQCIEAICRHPTVDGFNGRVLHPRAVYVGGQGTGLACNSSTHADLIPMINYVTCNNQGIWQPSLPKCFARCRLPDLGTGLIGYNYDDDDEWFGKKLHPGAFVRHGHSVKYQCLCEVNSQDCTASVRCLDGQWTDGGPSCGEDDILDKCQVAFDIPFLLADEKAKPGIILNEGESFNYKCIHGYTPMTNVTCIQRHVNQQPLCEPKNCTTHPYWIKNGYVKYQNRRHGGHAEYSCRNGYKLSSRRSLRCLFGQWESPYDRNHVVQCVADTCHHPGFIRHGKTYVVTHGTSRYILTANVSLRHGFSLQFECESGFMLVGNRGSTCFSGIWRPDEIPICVEDRHVSLQHTLHKFVSKG